MLWVNRCCGIYLALHLQTILARVHYPKVNTIVADNGKAIIKEGLHRLRPRHIEKGLERSEFVSIYRLARISQYYIFAKVGK